MKRYGMMLVLLGIALCSGVSVGAPVTLTNVPAYDWYHGCGPTAAASIIGYYDVHGCDDLFDASGWNEVKYTTNVKDQISSPEHNAKYDPTPDNSSLPVPTYTSIADWFQTSRDPLGYGGSYQRRSDEALEGYAQYRGYSSANSWYESYGNFTWNDLVNQIDAGRPMMFLVDSSGDGGTDHFVPVFGYDDRGVDGKYYGFYTTWSEGENIRWERFRGMSNSYDWGVAYGTYFNIPFTPDNNAPVALNDSYALEEDVPLSVLLASEGVLDNDTDADGDPLTALEVTSTAHGTLTLYSNGTLTYAPDANYNGTDSFTYKANDGLIDSNTATVTLYISAVNDVPVALNDTFTLNEDTEYVRYSYEGVLDNDYDVDEDDLTAIKVTNTAHGSLTFYANGALTYRPNPNYHGTDTFTYKANDGTVDSNLSTVTFNIESVNDAPIALDDSYGVNSGGTLVLYGYEGVLDNDDDVDVEDILEAVLVSDASHGNLTLYSSGGLSYTPNPGFSGIDSFTYRAFDGEAYSDLTTVLLEVLAGAIQIPGDTNGDYIVNETDASVLSDNWGKTISGGSSVGDFNGDGFVNATDASILAANWGDHTSESSPVPEPAGLGLLLTLITSALGMRQRR